MNWITITSGGLMQCSCCGAQEPWMRRFLKRHLHQQQEGAP